MSRSLLVVGSLLCLMLLVACGSATPEVVEVEKIVEVPVEVEKLVVATPTPVQIPESGRLPGRVDPAGSIISVSSYLGFQGVDTNISQDSATKVYYDEVFDYAIGQNPDGTLTPGFATEWEVSPDQLTWTFTIREGNEVPQRRRHYPQDVAWTWNRAVG